MEVYTGFCINLTLSLKLRNDSAIVVLTSVMQLKPHIENPNSC